MNLLLQSESFRKFLFFIAIGLSLVLLYHIGLRDGKNYQKSIYEQEFNKKLVEALKQREIKQEQANKQGIESVKYQERVKTVFKDRVKTITEYVELHPSPIECKMSEKEIVEYEKLMEEVK